MQLIHHALMMYCVDPHLFFITSVFFIAFILFITSYLITMLACMCVS